MANKTYYEQNYPPTKYEYSSRGYRNEHLHPSDTRQMNIQFNEPPATSVDYQYYQDVPEEEYEKEAQRQWEYPVYAAPKQKSIINTNKKTCSQPAVNTPRYYRNMAHRRPSALCIPLLTQPEPQSIRRKTKSQIRFEGEKSEKTARYRGKTRHHLLPPPPSLPPHAVTTSISNEQTDFETSSGDGRHSLRSRTQSSGSLSVDISSQVEVLNQSFDAVTREHKGKKIVYGNVQPVYPNVDPSQIKPRKGHRRHSKKNKNIVENTETWASQLWDLPEDVQGEATWSDKVDAAEWTNIEPPMTVNPCTSNMPNRKKSHNRKHYQHNFYQQQSTPPSQVSHIQTSHQHHQQMQLPPSPLMQTQPQHHQQQQQQKLIQQPPLQQQKLSAQSLHPALPTKLLDSNVPRPATRLVDSQEHHLNQGMKLDNVSSNSQVDNERINYLENLFSEMFAQGRFDNLSKKTRLDFIQDAYNKYSSSFDDSDNKPAVVNDTVDMENIIYSDGYPEQIGNQWSNDEYEKNVEEKSKFNQSQHNQFDNQSSSNHLSEDFNKSKAAVSQNDFNKLYMPIKGNQNNNSSMNGSITQSVTNFLLNVKPRRRSMKIEKNNNEENYSGPRFPNLIETMSVRYLGSNSARKESSVASESSEFSQIQNASPYSPDHIQNQNIKEYESPQQHVDTFNVPHKAHRKSMAVQNQQNMYIGTTLQPIQENIDPHFTEMESQNHNQHNYEATKNNYIFQEQIINEDNYSNSNPIDFTNVNNQYNEQFNYNCSLSENMNKLTVDNTYHNNEDYSSNMENNYMTIRKCQEILNQVRENFGECVKENPDVFENNNNNNNNNSNNNNNQYVVNNADPEIIYSDNEFDRVSTDMYNNPVNQQVQPQQVEPPYYQNNNEMEMPHSNDYCYEYQSDRSQNGLHEDNSPQINDYRRSMDNSKTQDAQPDYFISDENLQNYNDYRNVENHCKTSDFSAQKEDNLNSQDISDYGNIDQEKVKQFIHSLTGFDVLQRHKTSNDESQGTDEYHQDANFKYQPVPDQNNQQRPYAPLLSASDNVLSPENHRLQQKHMQHQRHKTKAIDLDKHRHYSIPQRQEIERMQQDCHSNNYNREKQESQINYSDFPHEVPNRNNVVPQEYKTSGSNELGNVDYMKLNNTQNKISTNDNRKPADDNYQKFYYNVCDYNYSPQIVQDQPENENYGQNVNAYYTVDYNQHIPVQQDNRPNSGTMNKLQKINDYNVQNQQLNTNQRVMTDQEQQTFYDIADPNNTQFAGNKNSGYDIDARKNCSENEPFLPGHNEQEYENEYSEEICEDGKNSVLKRKYCYMPNVVRDGNIENAVSDQSCYKSYIENLIDNSLQNSKPSAGSTQNINQGPVIQSQNDVVELETGKAIDLVMNESACQMDSKLCLEITQRLTDTLVQSNKDIPTPCLVALEEPVYLQQLKKLRWDHLRHIEREVKRLESLERFLDTCGCGHMMYTKNAG